MSLSYKVISVGLQGLTPLMFDRYPGDNDTELDVGEKMYLADDGRTLVLPRANIYSFLTAENTTSAPKAIFDSRAYKGKILQIRAYVVLPTADVPITREGKPIEFGGFKNDVDKGAGMRVHRAVARLAKGVPNPKIRPVLDLPWDVAFEIKLFENPDIRPGTLLELFEKGGLMVGFGTYRGMYGKFLVNRWDVAEGE